MVLDLNLAAFAGNVGNVQGDHTSFSQLHRGGGGGGGCVEIQWGKFGDQLSFMTYYSTASFGSDQKLTLGNIIDGGYVPFLGTIAAMEIYIGITEGVPGPIKKEIMKARCREHGVDTDPKEITPPPPMWRYDHRTPELAWFFCIETTT